MLCITFDNFGCASTLPPCPFPDIVPTQEWDSYNEIGLQLGHPRFLNLLKQLGIKTTYFAEGYAAVIHPDEMKRWQDDGHEIALHGWKHEMWTGLESKEQEDELFTQSMEAMEQLLGEKPIGFRPPGMRINSWTDDLLEKHGIQYTCQVLKSMPDDRFKKLGLSYPDEEPIISRGKILPGSERLIDGDLISPSYGGFFGELSGEEAYDEYFKLALEHERSQPEKPWTFIIHPHVSGSRSWGGFEKFLRGLHAELGGSAFKTARQAVLAE